MSLMGSMRSFLSSARTALQQYRVAPDGDVVTLVIGNESADLDSIVSSLLYAYLKTASLSSKRQGDLNGASKPRSWMHIPVLNIPRADVHIRPELLKLLPRANLEPEHLITIEELLDDPSDTPSFKAKTTSSGESNASKYSTLQAHHTRIFFVDHNTPDGPLGSAFEDSIVGCIDHHEDEGRVSRHQLSSKGDVGIDREAYPRIITKCGSCTSLVVKHGRPSWDRLSESAFAAAGANSPKDASDGVEESAVRRTWDTQIAQLALGSILIDTHNLTDTSKTTEDDVDAVKYLEAKVGIGPSGGLGEKSVFDRKGFFKEIKAAKDDIAELSVADCMKKDYKEWSLARNSGNEMKMGMSTIVKPLGWLRHKAHEEDAQALFADETLRSLMGMVSQYAAQRELAVYAILTTKTSKYGRPRREILMLVRDPSLHNLTNSFERQAGQALGLEEHDEHDAHSMDVQHVAKAWIQSDVSKTRKQVAPLLKRIIEQ
ncbi:MAG: Exopolyphosphatase [Alyxoria varia]|nr:MAG: Exopolyphosphatase [Alyxoria varia]